MDMAIVGNDLVIDTSDLQQQEDLIVTMPGSIKQFPDVGVGAMNFLEAEDVAGFLQEVARQFTSDGILVKELSYASGLLNINAVYP